MSKTVKTLLMSSLVLLGAGWSLYQLGSRLNLEAADSNQMLWDQAPGDNWLYIGGLMMLIAGSLATAAFRFWRGDRREQRATLSTGPAIPGSPLSTGRSKVWEGAP